MMPGTVFALRMVAGGAVRLYPTWVEVERASAEMHRVGVAAEVYEAAVTSWRRLTCHEVDGEASPLSPAEAERAHAGIEAGAEVEVEHQNGGAP